MHINIKLINMVTLCEECENFYIKNKEIRGIDGSVTYIPQHKCKLGHGIVDSTDGLVPRIRGFICKDFIKK